MPLFASAFMNEQRRPSDWLVLAVILALHGAILIALWRLPQLPQVPTLSPVLVATLIQTKALPQPKSLPLPAPIAAKPKPQPQVIPKPAVAVAKPQPPVKSKPKVLATRAKTAVPVAQPQPVKTKPKEPVKQKKAKTIVKTPVARPQPVKTTPKEPVKQKTTKTAVPVPQPQQTKATTKPVKQQKTVVNNTATTKAVAAPLPTAVAPPSYHAKYLDNPAPSYPARSRRLREQGTVLLRVYVEPSGRPARVELKQSSGHARLDKTALNTVKRWRFIPARQGDAEVAAWVIVPISFALRS